MFKEIEGILFEIKSDVMGQEAQKIVLNVKKYFNEHLSQYEVVKIRRKSFHKDDSHLFMVAAKKSDGTFAVWTGWNEDLQTMNHGHYDLPDQEACDRVMDEFYHGE